MSHKLLVSEIKTSSQETVSAELTEKVKECFEEAVSDQGWILIFNFQHFMDLITQKSYVLDTLSSFNLCEIRYIY